MKMNSLNPVSLAALSIPTYNALILAFNQSKKGYQHEHVKIAQSIFNPFAILNLFKFYFNYFPNIKLFYKKF